MTDPTQFPTNRAVSLTEFGGLIVEIRLVGLLRADCNLPIEEVRRKVAARIHR